jgi:hypothetical protein
MENIEKTRHITLRMEDKLLNKINDSPTANNVSDFIRKAIENELNKQSDYAKNEQEMQQELGVNIAKIKKMVETLNTKNTESKLSDIETKMMIYHERTAEVLNKQNEILKTIYKQSTIGANFAMHIMDTITKSKEFRKAEYATLLEIIQQEINKYF